MEIFMNFNFSQSGCKNAAFAIATSMALLLAACGGDSTETTASSPSTTPAVSTGAAPPTLQSVSGNNNATVSVSGDKKEDNETSSMSLLDFEGKVTEGASKDTVLNGKLILKGTSTDEGKTSTLQGKLITNNKQEPQPITDEQRSQIDALIKQYNEAVAALHDSFRESVGALAEGVEGQLKALREKWAAIDPKAADAQAQYEAVSKEAKALLEAFHKELETLNTKLQDDVKVLRDKLNTDIKAIAPGGNSAQDGSNIIPVTGTLAEDGKIALTFDLGTSGKIEGIGTRDEQGNFTGSFTGPQADDKGSWSATSGKRGNPEPRPTPTGSPSPMPTPTSSPTPPAGACTGQQLISLAAEISEVTSPTVFIMAKGMKLGAYANGFPIDHSAAAFINGTAADIAVGKRVKVCALGDLSMKEATPLKAKSVEILK
jgi:protein-tyrosine-phosphatase